MFHLVYLCMLRLVLIVLTLLTANVSKARSPLNENEVERFFKTRSLSIDSVATPYLYYQVYAWLGTKYRYAGETKAGIDCSGFVSEMYRQVYCITLNGGSKDIFPLTTPVEKHELKEGDLLFFRIRQGQISHVGIYLGQNKFAHASVSSGVIISDLDEDYYKRYFYKGGRIIAAVSH